MHRYFTIEELTELCECFSYLHKPKETITHFLYDSRMVFNPAQSLFIAIKTPKNDGHKFIASLYEKNVRNFLVEDKEWIQQFPDSNFIVVKNSLKAIQEMAGNHRNKFNIPIIAITGSNGKTIVKEWLYQLLFSDYKISRSPKSFNSQLGVPISLLQINNEHQLAIIETGISKPNEMELLSNIIKPTHVIFTNIGNAHLANFEDRQHIAHEKSKLATDTKVIFYPKDCNVLHQLLNGQTNVELHSWSSKQKAKLMVNKIVKKHQRTIISAIYKDAFIEIEIPFSDDAAIENAITCWNVLLSLNIENEKIKERMNLLQPVSMRLQSREGINNSTIIHDYYNADLEALAIAIQFLNNQTSHPSKTLILGDIADSETNQELLSNQIAEMINLSSVSKFIGIGKQTSLLKEKINTEKKLFFLDVEECLKNLSPDNFWNETILIKGSRNLKLEHVANFLESKKHDTVLDINLESIVNNLNYFKSKIPAGTKLMVMVKAFSYGSGVHEIAQVLQFNNVDYLAVAYSDEGVQLRQKGILLPIMVMNPSEDSFESLIRYNLEPEIYSFKLLNAFTQALKHHLPFNKKFNVHIKLNTGMNRLGFDEADIVKLGNYIFQNRQLNLVSVFSHLAAGESPEHYDFTVMQIERFKRMCNELKEETQKDFLMHILNTGGIQLHKDAVFNMVRLGIGLYGISPLEEEKKNLSLVGTLRTKINQIRWVEPPETVGYGRSGVLHEKTKIATIPIGYADGFSRKFGNGNAYVSVKGKKAFTIGNICMDMTMINVTNIDAEEGDEVIVFGEEPTVEYLAGKAQTIPYEILAMISQRIKRNFIEGF